MTAAIVKGTNRSFFQSSDYQKIISTLWPAAQKCAVIADMLRVDMLSTAYWAKSGHLGASMSAAEILSALYFEVMKIDPKNPQGADRDTFVMSKGHAAPGMYSVLAARGFFPSEKLKTFRRLGGLAGHVDRSVPGVDSNTGSLGMGISKAKGWALSQKMKKNGGRSFVIVGDGELQEGQNWEAIQAAASLILDNLYLFVDRNHVQTDLLVKDIMEPFVFEEKFKAFGWETLSIDGHSTDSILKGLSALASVPNKPKVIIAETIKGKGVSFMEHPAAMKKDQGYYYWHSKVPNHDEYLFSLDEIRRRITGLVGAEMADLLSIPDGKDALPRAATSGKPPVSAVQEYSEIILKIAEKNKDVVIIDGDLEESCGLRPFHKQFPDRFVELGCAEQDMVSTAGSLALAGKIPVVNTYSAFLSSRANEQIFNNATEKSKVIYVGHMAGLIPATPGKSHQAIRDISILKSIPNILIFHPSNGVEMETLLRYAVEKYEGPSYFRVANAPGSREIPSSKTFDGKVGCGSIIREGKDRVLIGYGHILLSQALGAAEILSKKGIEVRVISLPWLNRVDGGWLQKACEGIQKVFCLEDHSDRGGLGDEILRSINQNSYLNQKIQLNILGIDRFAESGQVDETLAAFGMSSERIAERITSQK